MPAPVFERITIIGLGLIGSSIARAVRANKLAETIVGCDQNELSIAYARAQGFIDVAAHDATIAVQGSDLVILATPPSTLESLTEKIAPHLARGCMVMDMCSVKRMAMDAIATHLPMHVDFVPTHPIAGSEQTGVSAGRADLFDKKRIIVTPNEPLQGDTLTKVNNFWQGMGARVEGMPPHLHDMVYGYVSHLPQLLAFSLSAPLGASVATGEGDETFARFTRLSGSSPALWSD
ncbi:MAG: prephenate dehydrogenase/arogenate dehydrogenase family protein, partial [Alphaproteobacteria bacterium]|nr:prephenate dehydrogenase/arogenate dehydrogenase family protein [Alphaproteobacteria bacterium]